MKPIEHYEKSKSTYLNELINLAKIPSISFAGYDPKNVEASATHVYNMFRRFGITQTQVVKYKDAHPYVIAYIGEDPSKPTYLLYAHHDVQPVGDESKWKTPPFEPTARNGRLYGRGAADDKAGILIHLAAIDAFFKTNTALPVNLILLIEGEEEIGSEHLEEFLKDRKDLFKKIDGMILTDTANYDTGVPALTTALRGIVATEVELSTMKQSVHSGMWGGPVPDPTMALCKLLSKLVDDNGRIQIPGIYDKVKEPSQAAQRALKNLNYDEKTLRHQSGMLPGTKLLQPKQDILESIWYQPALTINAIQASGRDRPANIICGSAWAKVSIRTVPDMDGQDVFNQLKSFLTQHVPWGCELHLSTPNIGSPWRTDPEHPVFEIALGALKDGYGTDPMLIGCGGSIPFVGPMSAAFGGIPALLVGVEDPYTYAHSENESLNMGDFEKSIRSEIFLLERLKGIAKH